MHELISVLLLSLPWIGIWVVEDIWLDIIISTVWYWWHTTLFFWINRTYSDVQGSFPTGGNFLGWIYFDSFLCKILLWTLPTVYNLGKTQAERLTCGRTVFIRLCFVYSVLISNGCLNVKVEPICWIASLTWLFKFNKLSIFDGLLYEHGCLNLTSKAYLLDCLINITV